MLRNTFIQRDGCDRIELAPTATSAMRSMWNDCLACIESECSVSANCTTCRRYVDQALIVQFNIPSMTEKTLVILASTSELVLH